MAGVKLAAKTAVKRWRKKLSQLPENIQKNSGHHGKCSHCGGAWNWKDGETIWYYKGRGMFPICQSCFESLSNNEVAHYCWRKWCRDKKRSRRLGGLKEAERRLDDREFIERVMENILRKRRDLPQEYSAPERVQREHFGGEDQG